MKDQSTTIFHIDDDAWWLESVSQLLKKRPDFHPVGTATTGTAGFRQISRSCAALVILDLWLPDVDGVQVAHQLLRLSPPPRILFLTARTDEATLYRIQRHSIAGVVLKSSETFQQLHAALTTVRNGGFYFPLEVRNAIRAFHAASDAFPKILSDREIELLDYLGYGLSDREISRLVGTSPATVKSHRQHIMAKLNLHRTEDLMRWASQRGFSDLTLPAPPCLLPV